MISSSQSFQSKLSGTSLRPNFYTVLAFVPRYDEVGLLLGEPNDADFGEGRERLDDLYIMLEESKLFEQSLYKEERRRGSLL